MDTERQNSGSNPWEGPSSLQKLQNPKLSHKVSYGVNLP
jgi:hypothetical protein